MHHPWILLTDSEDPEHRYAWGPFPTFEAAKTVAVEDGHEPGSYAILPLMLIAPTPQPDNTNRDGV